MTGGILGKISSLKHWIRQCVGRLELVHEPPIEHMESASEEKEPVMKRPELEFGGPFRAIQGPISALMVEPKSVRAIRSG